MDENKHFRCSFCGKTEQEVDKLLSGPGVYICNECIDMCNSILDGEFEHKGGFTATELPKPKEIKAFLDEYVVGQEDAKKILSVALASTMVLSLAACGGKSTTETTQAAAETTAAAESSAAETTAEADGFNLAVCLASEPQTMDPALNSTVDGAIMTQHMFEGLAKYVNDGNGNAQIVAGQAESWDL